MQRKLLFIVWALFPIMLFSCQKEELLYSCDPQVNQWAKENLNNIRQMTRANFVKIEDIQHQRAAFRAFSPEQRQAVWVVKLTEVLSLGWNADEKQHIKSLMSLLNKYAGLFCDEFTEQQQDELRIEAYKWAEYAKDVLGWNNKTIYAIVANPNKMLTKSGDLEEKRKYTPTLKTRSEHQFGTCECTTQYHGDDHILIPDCDQANAGCHGSSDCERKNWSCGLFWGDPCDGICY